MLRCFLGLMLYAFTLRFNSPAVLITWGLYRYVHFEAGEEDFFSVWGQAKNVPSPIFNQGTAAAAAGDVSLLSEKKENCKKSSDIWLRLTWDYLILYPFHHTTTSLGLHSSSSSSSHICVRGRHFYNSTSQCQNKLQRNSSSSLSLPLSLSLSLSISLSLSLSLLGLTSWLTLLCQEKFSDSLQVWSSCINTYSGLEKDPLKKHTLFN